MVFTGLCRVNVQQNTNHLSLRHLKLCQWSLWCHTDPSHQNLKMVKDKKRISQFLVYTKNRIKIFEVNIYIDHGKINSVIVLVFVYLKSQYLLSSFEKYSWSLPSSVPVVKRFLCYNCSHSLFWSNFWICVHTHTTYLLSWRAKRRIHFQRRKRLFKNSGYNLILCQK